MGDYVKRSSVINFLIERKKAFEGTLFPVDLSDECSAISDSISDERLFPPEDVAPVKRGVWLVTREHLWHKDEFGQIDEMAWDHEFHNGPSCDICYRSPCILCEPDCLGESDCKPHYKCSECGAHEVTEFPYCHCGARMTSESLVKDGLTQFKGTESDLH